MRNALAYHLTQALAVFSSTTRLYELMLGDDGARLSASGLLVEAFYADDAVHDIGPRDVIVLSTSAHIEATSLLGQTGCLEISLADGTRARFPATSAKRQCSAAMAVLRVTGFASCPGSGGSARCVTAAYGRTRRLSRSSTRCWHLTGHWRDGAGATTPGRSWR